jgi:sugar O-acyltransferase (sialic acid O-acetyltransferase NeuD family)
MKPLIIVGAGGFGREVACLVNDINQQRLEWNLLGFVDDEDIKQTSESFPVIGVIDSICNLDPKPWVVIAIADTKLRKKLANRLGKMNIPLATLIHPSVIRSEYINIGEGTIICAGVIITTNVRIGSHCIINLGSLIGHDTVLGDYTSMMPGTNLAGEVSVGEGCYFGLNSCVINRTTIGEWSVIGAGATVVDDIPAYSVAVGVPARVIKKVRSEGLGVDD